MRNLVVVGFTAALLGSAVRAQELPQTTPHTQRGSVTPLSPSGSLPQMTQPVTAGNPAAPAAEAALPLVENLQSLDPDRVALAWMNNRWVLTMGETVLKDFGRREADGQAALRLIRGLHLTQCGTVGSPAPLMEYWLCDGQAPRGPVSGCTVLNFEAGSLHLESAQGQWCLRDAHRVLFNFGTRPADARLALAVLRKYKFTRVAVIGQLTPSMFVFLANPYDDVPTDKPAHQRVSHETPEVAAKKADELNRLKERIPGLGAETVAQPTLRTLRTPDQPRQAFSPTAREYGGDGLASVSGARSVGATDYGDRVPFDWRRVQTRLEGTDWQLAVGSVVIARFGADQEAARRALDVIRYYHFTEMHLVGRPERVFSYFLVNGTAPRGLPFGVAADAFDPRTLKVRQVDGKWALCAGDQPVIALGTQQDEAADLLQVIRLQNFDHVCRLGRPDHPFTFLVRTR